ncbi:MAG: glycosyl hydrolase family 28-related protein [Lacticaseibacillus rhamnosus]
MAIRTYNFTFDVKRSIMPEPVFMRQNDATGSVLINVRLVDNGMPVPITGDLEFRAMTADSQNVVADTSGFSLVDVNKGLFTYALPNQLSMTPGKIRIAYFMMIDASGNASTLSFAIFVKPSADLTPSGAKDYISIIDGLIKAFNEWNETAQSSWQDFVNSNKEIIESVDPGGKVLSEITEFRRSDMLNKTFDTSKARGDFFDIDLQQRAINVKWFGAKGDGENDDTQAFKDAISFANTNGFSIYVPSGQYVISSTLSLSGVQFFGSHKSDTYIFPKGISTLFQLGDDVLLSDLCIANRMNGADVVDIALGGNGLDSGGNIIERITVKGTDGNFKSTFLSAAPQGTSTNSHHVFPNTVKDISAFDMTDVIVLNASNYGWVNGNLFENITVQGFTHSAVFLTADDANGNGISHNTFRNIQAEYLSTAPETARAFIINCAVNNRFEMIHTWTDGNLIEPSLTMLLPAFLKTSDLMDNQFDGIFESGISIDSSVLKFNDFSKISINRWTQPHFNNQITSLLGVQSFSNKNLLSDDLVSDFSNKGIIPQLQMAGAIKMANVSTGIDNVGPYILITASTGDSLVIFIPLNGQLNVQIKNIASLTSGVEFSIDGQSDSNVSVQPSFMYRNPSSDARIAPPKILKQAALNIDGVYRFTQTIDNSASVDSAYSESYASVTISGVTSIKIRRLILVQGNSSVNVEVKEGHHSKAHRALIPNGQAINGFSDIGLFMLPISQVANYPTFSTSLLDTKTDASGNQIVSYPYFY